MFTYEVDIPGQGTFEVQSPTELTDEQVYLAATGQTEMPKRDLSAGEVAKGALVNFPGSTANLLGDVASAVLSPIDTAKTVLDLGAGILQSALPESLVQAIGEDAPSREMASRVGEFYVDRYGSLEDAKRTIANDPAGALADVASVLYGGGAALRGTAGATRAATGGRVTLPNVQRAGEAVRSVGTAIDPLVATTRGVTAGTKALGANVVAPGLGMTTGAGQEPVRQAFMAGQEGGARAKQFRENIGGTADQMEILEAAKKNLNELRRQRAEEYRAGKVDISKDKTQLSFDDIDSAINKAKARTRYEGKVIDQAGAQALKNVEKIVKDWKKSDPSVYRTPEAMDALKRSVGSILEKQEPRTNAYGSVSAVYNAIKNNINQQAPTYANTMRNYTNASETIREIERSLSLGNKASADTAMRKLQSLMRDNVNTNFGMRTRVGKTLEEQGGNMMMPGLAGQSLQSLAPRGIQGATAMGQTGVAGLAGGIPAAIGAGLASSPRVVGEAAYGAGMGAKGVGNVTDRIPALLNPELYNLIYQTERSTR